MPSPRSNRGGFRWPLTAGAGLATALVGLVTQCSASEPSLVSLWLIGAGLGLAGLSGLAWRSERAAAARLGASDKRRRRAELGLAAAEARSRELADASQDMTSLHGPDGKLTYVSPASREVLGYEPHELTGR